MKNLLRPSSGRRLLVCAVALALLTTSGLFARYGAFVYSTGQGSFGAWGLSWNWRTKNAAVRSAVNTATYYNGSYLDGYRFAWWNHRGYEAGARGYDYYGDYVRFGWSRGWRSRGAAVNYAVNRLGYNTYDLGYASGYNR